MTYTYRDIEGDEFTITNSDDGSVYIVEFSDVGAYISREDAPRVALEILKAAGHGGDGDFILVNSINTAVACLEKHIENTEREAEIAAHNKRRDELANKFAPRDEALAPNWYGNVSPGLQNAIDHIISMESQK